MDFYVVLAHWNNTPSPASVDMLLHPDTYSWLPDNQSWLLLLNAVCLAKRQQTQILYFCFVSPDRVRSHHPPHVIRAWKDKTYIYPHYVNGVLCKMLLRIAVYCYFFFVCSIWQMQFTQQIKQVRIFTMLLNFIQ